MFVHLIVLSLMRDEQPTKKMQNTDKVHIKGDDTDLRFIKGIGAVACGGTHNIRRRSI